LIDTSRKQVSVTRFQRKAGDTGSPEVQIALLSEPIRELTQHLRTPAKDQHTRRGQLLLVSQRRGLLDYLARNDRSRYSTLIESLGIRH